MSRVVQQVLQCIEGLHAISGEKLMQSTHVTALQEKHAGLEAQLRDEMRRPHPNDELVRQIKRRKLKIKEELSEI